MTTMTAQDVRDNFEGRSRTNLIDQFILSLGVDKSDEEQHSIAKLMQSEAISILEERGDIITANWLRSI